MADLMQQAREMLPCPFCGCAATLRVGERMLVDAHVICEGCSAEGPGFGADATEGDFTMEALEAWNRRAAPEGCIPERAMLALATGWRRNASVSVGGRTVLIQCAESLEVAVIAARPQEVSDGA